MDSKKRIDERRRLHWIALSRAVLCAFAAAIIALNLEPAMDLERSLPFAVVAVAFAANVAFFAGVSKRLPGRLVAAAQIALDVVFVTALVYATGGVNSNFLLLYFGPILAAAVAFSRSAALLTASLSTIGLFACAAAYAVAADRPPLVNGVWLWRGVHSASALASVLSLQAAALHVVAFLASTLTWRLRRASIETEQILENMSDGVMTVDGNGRVVFANSRALAMLGVADGETLIARALGDVAPPAACASFRDVMSSRRAGSVELEVGPAALPVQLVAVPVADHAGGLRGANLILHDTTERRRLIEAIRRADRLEAAATTVASIAHEIRNPLAAIRGSAQELKKVLELSDADRRLLDLVLRESDRLNRILTEFLNFSRMPKPQMSDFDLRELLDEVAAQVAMSFPGKKPEIAVSGRRGLLMTGDSEQLRQVFVNVALNAVEATGGRGPVHVEVEYVADGVVVTTRDGGPGVDDSIRDRIFEPFFTTKTTGTGLGLPIACRIVEDHRGAIDLSRSADGWTCVKVFLPRAEGNGKPSARAVAHAPAA